MVNDVMLNRSSVDEMFKIIIPIISSKEVSDNFISFYLYVLNENYEYNCMQNTILMKELEEKLNKYQFREIKEEDDKEFATWSNSIEIYNEKYNFVYFPNYIIKMTNIIKKSESRPEINNILSKLNEEAIKYKEIIKVAIDCQEEILNKLKINSKIFKKIFLDKYDYYAGYLDKLNELYHYTPRCVIEEDIEGDDEWTR